MNNDEMIQVQEEIVALEREVSKAVALLGDHELGPFLKQLKAGQTADEILSPLAGIELALDWARDELRKARTRINTITDHAISSIRVTGDETKDRDD